MTGPTVAGAKAAAGEVWVRRSAIRRYQRLLDEQAEQARLYVERMVGAYLEDNPGKSVAETRQEVYELLRVALPNFTGLAETLSCEFMQGLCEAYGWDGVVPELFDTTDYQVVERKLHYFAGYLADGDVDRFKDEVASVTSYFVRRSAQDNLVENCKKAKIRYARVPSGLETCPFCFMLASRGFVYHTELSAGLQHAFHEHCTCTIVPGAKGRTRIDGYDPGTMHENWKSCEDTLGGEEQLRKDWDALSGEERSSYLVKHPARYGTGYDEAEAIAEYMRKRVMEEVETRDWHWLYTGEVPQPHYESEWLLNQIRAKRPHEEMMANLLSELGLRVDMVDAAQGSKGRIADSTIGRERWEFKAPTGNGFLTIKNQLKSNLYGNDHSTLRPQSDKVVISNVRSSMTMDDMIRGLNVALDPEQGLRPEELEKITEVILLDKNGRMLRKKTSR